jgi:hypothetical protein
VDAQIGVVQKYPAIGIHLDAMLAHGVVADRTRPNRLGRVGGLSEWAEVCRSEWRRQLLVEPLGGAVDQGLALCLVVVAHLAIRHPEPVRRKSDSVAM